MKEIEKEWEKKKWLEIVTVKAHYTTVAFSFISMTPMFSNVKCRFIAIARAWGCRPAKCTWGHVHHYNICN